VEREGREIRTRKARKKLRGRVVGAQQGKTTHERGPQHGGRCAHQHGVHSDAQDSGNGTPPATQQAAEAGHKQARDDGNIETGNVKTKSMWFFN
jgi:hypothetical protein